MSGEYKWHPAYAEVHARFPGVKLDGGGMMPAQGRVLYHEAVQDFRLSGVDVVLP